MDATETVTHLPKITRPPLKVASLKDAKVVIEEGAQRVARRARARGPPLCINNHGINDLEESDGEYEMDSWIFPTTNGGPSNWTANDFVLITFVQK